jgi:hypothetical protein
MHQLLPLKWKISLVIGLATVIGLIAPPLGLPTLAIGAVIGTVELIVIFLAAKSWKYLSRIPFLPLWMRVDLSGEWDGVIQSRWRSAGEPELLVPIDCQITVHQRWDDVVMIMQTDKMVSRTSGLFPSYDPITKELCFQYFFRTEPFANSLEKNPPQTLGCARAWINLDNPSKITIQYTNERGAGGDISLTRKKRSQRAQLKNALKREPFI